MYKVKIWQKAKVQMHCTKSYVQQLIKQFRTQNWFLKLP